MVKAARRDLVYWLPTEGLLTVGFTFFQRIVNKVLVDYTGFVLLRHPCETGGLLYSLTLLWSQVSAVISVVLYQSYYDDEVEGRRSKIGAAALYSIVCALCLVWMTSFYMFTRSIDPNYLHTFFSTMTASQYAVHLFRNASTDRTKVYVLKIAPSFWEPIREEVKAFTLANWSRWETEKPKWFNEHWISTVPDDFIPHLVNKNRRKSSVFESLLGFQDAEAKQVAVRSGSKSASKVAAA